MPKLTFAEMVAARVRRRLAGPVETSDCADANPLGLLVGASAILVDTATYRDLAFTVRAIRRVAERAGGRDHGFSDYELRAVATPDDPRADEEGVVRRTLRVVPVEEPDAALRFDAILLERFFACSYAEAMDVGLYHPDYHPDAGWASAPALQDPGGLFVDHEAGLAYRRRFGDLDPHRATATRIRDLDGDGKVQADEVEHGVAVTYWDYQLAPVDGSGSLAGPEFLFAEMDSDGVFTLDRGVRVRQEQVIAL